MNVKDPARKGNRPGLTRRSLHANGRTPSRVNTVGPGLLQLGCHSSNSAGDFQAWRRSRSPKILLERAVYLKHGRADLPSGLYDRTWLMILPIRALRNGLWASRLTQGGIRERRLRVIL